MKTFFPAHWIREQVMECVLKHLPKAMQVKDPALDMLKFESIYNKQIKIVYIFNPKNNYFKSIYPSKI